MKLLGGLMGGAAILAAVVVLALLARPVAEQRPEGPVVTPPIAAGAEPRRRTPPASEEPRPASEKPARTAPTCYVEGEVALAYLAPAKLDELIDKAGGEGRMLQPGLFAGSLEGAASAFGGELESGSSPDGEAWLRMDDEMGPHLQRLLRLRSAQGVPVWLAANTRREVPCPSGES